MTPATPRSKFIPDAEIAKLINESCQVAKPSHEERARAVAGKNYHPQHGTNLFERYVADLAAAFAEVEAEAKREAVEWMNAATDKPGAHLCGVCKRAHVPVEPYPPSVAKSGTAMRAWDQGEFCQECGRKPCESFIVCATKAMERCAPIAAWRAERDAMVKRLRSAISLDEEQVKVTEVWGHVNGVQWAAGETRTGWFLSVVQNLPDLHPLPKFTVPGESDAVVPFADSYRKDAAGKVHHVRTEIGACTCGAVECGTLGHSQDGRVEMPIYDPGASGLPMPKLAVPLHGGPGEPVTGDARTETQRTASCTCGAAVTYGAENARQGSPIHARWCEMA